MASPVPLLTLVVASYNHSPFARECLESVRVQSLESFDLIITDDASRDESQAVIRDVLASLSLTAKLIFHEENVGVCRTFNEALAQVRTRYVCFLAMDDWMREDRLSVQASAMESLGELTGLVYSDAWVFNPDYPESTRLFSSIAMNRQMDTKADNYHELLRGNWIPAPAVMLRVDSARAVGGYDESLVFEDYDLWCRIARDFEIHSIPEPLVTYRETTGSLSRELDRTSALHLDTARLLSKHFGHSAEVDEIVAIRMFREGIAAYKAGAEPRQVARYLRPHVRRHPTAANIGWAVTPHLGRAMQRALIRRESTRATCA